MTKNSLFGSYRAADTPLHRLDARVKMVLLLALTVLLFAAQRPLVLGLAAVVVIAVSLAGGLSLRALLRAMKPPAFLLLFTFLVSSLVIDGTGDVALVGGVGISYAGASKGLLVATRVIVLVWASLALTSSTSSVEVADALASLTSPLARLGVPTGDFAMIASVALRFIPLTVEELERLRNAQRARGVDFSSGSALVRIRRWLTVLMPLVVALFRRADDLACAMHERCYSGRGRTRLARPMRRADVAALVVGLGMCAAAMILC